MTLDNDLKQSLVPVLLYLFFLKMWWYKLFLLVVSWCTDLILQVKLLLPMISSWHSKVFSLNSIEKAQAASGVILGLFHGWIQKPARVPMCHEAPCLTWYHKENVFLSYWRGLVFLRGPRYVSYIWPLCRWESQVMSDVDPYIHPFCTPSWAV